MYTCTSASAWEYIDSKISQYWSNIGLHYTKSATEIIFQYVVLAFLPLTLLPVTFLPLTNTSDILFTADIFTSDIITSDIFYLWHLCLWHYYLWHYYLWHFYLWHFYLWHFYFWQIYLAPKRSLVCLWPRSFNSSTELGNFRISARSIHNNHRSVFKGSSMYKFNCFVVVNLTNTFLLLALLFSTYWWRLHIELHYNYVKIKR